MNAIRTLVFALCATCGAAGAAFAQDDSAWAEQKTTASDGTTNTYFGSAAAVLGATAAIGADGDDDFAGSVYLLTKTGGAWSEAQKVGADDRAGGDEFGYRVALADGLMVATAFSATVGANTSQGAAYVFVHDAGAWTQSQKLLADDGLQFDDFGSAVAIDGTRLLIGANGATVGANAAQGAAYVFTSDGATWMQAQKLVADDGVAFDVKSLIVEPIREDQQYGGLRAVVTAHIAKARIKVQVDVGFGDAITPAPKEIDFPVLLELPAPRVRAYPMETVVAEKLDAMVQLGLANSRMKDFYDLMLLSRSFVFEGDLLVRAIRATFGRRKTELPTELPVGLTPAFAADPTKRSQWTAFVRKTGAQDAGDLQTVIEQIIEFAGPALLAAASGDEYAKRWSPAGAWTPGTGKP